jgi:hypothetical protein
MISPISVMSACTTSPQAQDWPSCCCTAGRRPGTCGGACCPAWPSAIASSHPICAGSGIRRDRSRATTRRRSRTTCGGSFTTSSANSGSSWRAPIGADRLPMRSRHGSAMPCAAWRSSMHRCAVTEHRSCSTTAGTTACMGNWISRRRWPRAARTSTSASSSIAPGARGRMRSPERISTSTCAPVPQRCRGRAGVGTFGAMPFATSPSASRAVPGACRRAPRSAPRLRPQTTPRPIPPD